MSKYLDMYCSFCWRPAKRDFACEIELESDELEVPSKWFYGTDLQVLIYGAWNHYLLHWRVLNGDDPPPVQIDFENGLSQLTLWE